MDINLNLNYFTISNSTDNNTNNNCASLLNLFLMRKSNKYDLYFFGNELTSSLADYFVDLKMYMPKDLLDMYSSTKTKSCEIANNMVCLVSLISIQN